MKDQNYVETGSWSLERNGRGGAGNNLNETGNPRKRRGTSTSLIRNSILSGSIAGVASTVIFHPFDVIRTKMQSRALAQGTLACPTTGVVGAEANYSPLQLYARTVKFGGYRSLYTGLSLPLGAQALYKATVFSVNETCRAILIDWKRKKRDEIGVRERPVQLTLSEACLCGAVAGAVNGGCFVTPVEFIRNQLIAQNSRLVSAAEKRRSVVGSSRTAHVVMAGPFDVIRATVESDGIFGLWCGARVTVVRDCLGCGLFFTMFEIGKRNFGRDKETGEKSVFGTAISGAMAGLGFWAVALPLDTVKTLVQTGETRCASSTISEVWRRDGYVGLLNLYRGWQVAFGRGAPAAVVTVGTYEFISSLLNK